LIGASKEFTVHNALVFQISRPLAKLITNGMAESEAGCARLCDVDEEIFSRFVFVHLRPRRLIRLVTMMGDLLPDGDSGLIALELGFASRVLDSVIDLR